MRFLLALICLLPFGLNAATFTEFYVQTTGNNLNSGHTPDDTATFTATGGFFTNNTSASVCTYFKSGLNPVAGGVTNGAWASIYPDATTVAAVYVGLVTAADDGADTITVSLTAKAGSVPASDNAGATTIKVGGAWSGPNTNQNPSTPFPFNFATFSLTNSAAETPCVNIKAAVYSVTNAITHTLAGPIWFQGYTTTPHDGGKATIDGGTVYPGFALIAISGIDTTWADLIFDHNGASGTGIGVTVTGNESTFFRCKFSNMRQSGVSISANYSQFVECEAATNNLNNTSGHGGFLDSGGSQYFIRCVAHDHATATGVGFQAANSVLYKCISYSNASHGFVDSGANASSFIQCDAFNNGGSGLNFSAAVASGVKFLENCNFFKNGAYGVASSGAIIKVGFMFNSAFGAGNQTNVSGNMQPTLSTLQSSGFDTSSYLIYASDQNPWLNATNGIFTIVPGATTKSAGRGSFYLTNTISYPDIGAAQSASTNAAAAGGTTAHTFAQ